MKGILRRKEIIEAGKQLFSRNGYYETHVESILREAKIGKGTFYQYFRNKEELFAAILDDFLTKWEKNLDKIMREEHRHDLYRYYRSVMKRSFRYFLKDIPISTILLRVAPGTGTTFDPFIDRFEGRLYGLIVDFLRRGIDTGKFREDLDVELMGHILTGAHIRIFYSYFIRNQEQRTVKMLDHIADQVFEVVVSAIGVKGGDRPS